MVLKLVPFRIVSGILQPLPCAIRTIANSKGFNVNFILATVWQVSDYRLLGASGFIMGGSSIKIFFCHWGVWFVTKSSRLRKYHLWPGALRVCVWVVIFVFNIVTVSTERVKIEICHSDSLLNGKNPFEMESVGWLRCITTQSTQDKPGLLNWFLQGCLYFGLDI